MPGQLLPHYTRPARGKLRTMISLLQKLVLAAAIVLIVIAVYRRAMHSARVDNTSTGEQPLDPEPNDDTALTAAWNEARSIVHQEDLPGMDRARLSCAELLHVAAEQDISLDIEAVEAVMLMRKHLPALVEETARACRHLAEEERDARVGQMVSRLTGFGDHARAILGRLDADSAIRLNTLHAHLSSRLDPDKDR